MKNTLSAFIVFAALLASTAVAQAATFDFILENVTGLRVTRAVVFGGEGEITGFTSMNRGEQTFQVTLPDGQCRATLRFTFSDVNSQFRRNYHDVANFNFCEYGGITLGKE